MTLNQSEIDLGGNQQLPPMTTRAELLAAFDQNVADTRAALVGKSDGELMAPWALKRDGQTHLLDAEGRRSGAFVMSHLIHHRAQLSVYLRMHDVPIPSMYGPSARRRRLLSESETARHRA